MSDDDHSPPTISRHSAEDLYNRLGVVEKTVAGLVPLIQRLSDDLRSNTATMQAEISGVREKQNQPTNWFALGSLAIAVFLASASWTSTQQQGIVEANSRQDIAIASVKSSIDQRTPLIYSTSQLVDQLRADLTGQEQTIGSQRERVALLEGRVADLDRTQQPAAGRTRPRRAAAAAGPKEIAARAAHALGGAPAVDAPPRLVR